MAFRGDESGTRFSGLLVGRRHIDLVRVSSALCS